MKLSSRFEKIEPYLFVGISKTIAEKKAKGIDPIKYGKSNLMFIFLVLTKFIEFPDTTMMLQNNAKIGKI